MWITSFGNASLITRRVICGRQRRLSSPQPTPDAYGLRHRTTGSRQSGKQPRGKKRGFPPRLVANPPTVERAEELHNVVHAVLYGDPADLRTAGADTAASQPWSGGSRERRAMCVPCDGGGNVLREWLRTKECARQSKTAPVRLASRTRCWASRRTSPSPPRDRPSAPHSRLAATRWGRPTTSIRLVKAAACAGAGKGKLQQRPCGCAATDRHAANWRGLKLVPD